MKYNYSVAFMKSFFSFCVICLHYYTDNGGAFGRICRSSVPIFVMISFYLTFQDYVSYDPDKIRKRLIRLAIPYFGWGLIYYFGYLLGFHLLKLIGIGEGFFIRFTIKDLFWQLALGSDRYINGAFWYLFDLLIITLLYAVLSGIVRSEDLFIKTIVLLGLLCLCIQYFGLNQYMFGNTSFEIKYSLGRLFEVIPYSCIGLLAGYYRITDRLLAWGGHTFSWVLLAVLLVLTVHGGLFSDPAGFGYEGVFLIVYAVVIFVGIMILPFEPVPGIIKKVIRAISGCSLGVYCIHGSIGMLWYGLEQAAGIHYLSFNTLYKCVIIFVMSFAISYCISRIPCRYVRMFVE